MKSIIQKNKLIMCLGLSKKLLVTIAFIIISLSTFAQVGVGTTTPDNSAALDVTATNRGLLIPRVANTAAIAAPADGLIIYDISAKCVKAFQNGAWSICFEEPPLTIANIVAASSSPATGGLPSLADLAEVGVTGATGDQAAYEEAIANAAPAPTTLPELQAIIDAVNILAQIGAEADSPDTVNSVVTVAQINSILPAITGALVAKETAYQDYIDANPGLFSNPATQAEVQAMVDAVNNTTLTVATPTYQGTSVINATGIGYNGETVPAASTITVQLTTNTAGTPYTLTATDATTGLTYSKSGVLAAAGTFPVVLEPNAVVIPEFTSGVINMTLTGADNTLALAPRIDVKSIPASATTVTDVTYGTQTWMDRNLGARRVATAIDDVFAYGNHYQWGRPADGHEITVWNGTSHTAGRGFADATALEALATTDAPGHPNFILTNVTPFDWRSDNNNNRWATASQGPCPVGYHVPTDAEWVFADAAALGSGNGTNGGNTTGWDNNTETYESALKLPSAGRRQRTNGLLNFQGTYGSYWSSTVSGTNARALNFYSTAAGASIAGRADGFSVRCLKNYATVASLDNCATPTTAGTLTESTVASGVSFTINYSGGNGLPYAGEAVTSTGVTGLTATLTAGTLATGAGSVTYNVTGTPVGNGTANFAISLGGQTCSVALTVECIALISPATTIVDVTSATGKVWMDRNLGATQAATSSTDAAAYGSLYQWGRNTDGHEVRTSCFESGPVASGSEGFKHIINGVSPWDWLSTSDNARWNSGTNVAPVKTANDPCPAGYRVPTNIELNAERVSWISNNAAGAFASALKLPVAGNRSRSNASLSYEGVSGYYWTSTVGTTTASMLTFSSTTSAVSTAGKATGLSVRCIKEYVPATAFTVATPTYQGTSVIDATGIGYNGEAVPAASTITVQATVTVPGAYALTATDATTGLTYSKSGTFAAAGTFPVVLEPNAVVIPEFTSGVINMTLTGADNTLALAPRIDVKSIPASATTVTDVTYGTQTWMDRNLGARRVATAIDDVFAYGNYYQWGRPADGHEITVWNGTTKTTGRGLYNTTATLSATTTPGHNNFITINAAPFDWLATQADPDRWATANQGPCPTGYHVPTTTEWTTADNFGGWNNNTDTYNSNLKLPSGKSRDKIDGTISSLAFGYSQGSSLSGTNITGLVYTSSYAKPYFINRASGITVRCIKN